MDLLVQQADVQEVGAEVVGDVEAAVPLERLLADRKPRRLLEQTIVALGEEVCRAHRRLPLHPLDLLPPPEHLPLGPAGIDYAIVVLLCSEDRTREDRSGLSEAAHRFDDEPVPVLAGLVDGVSQVELAVPEGRVWE